MTDRLSELRELLKAATPGPWYIDGPCHVASACREHGANICTTEDGGTLAGEQQANAALIVAMRNALPALLDVVEAARGVPHQWNAALTAVQQILDGSRGPTLLERLEAAEAVCEAAIKVLSEWDCEGHTRGEYGECDSCSGPWPCPTANYSDALAKWRESRG